MRNILFIGAHPDDCDFSCGGTAALMASRGDAVRFVSITNGDRGHFAPEYVADRELLAARRREEGRRAAAVIGADFATLNVHDGDIYVTPELTEAMIRLIRSWGEPGRGPDLVLLNRPNDYHRDHRYAAQLVLDTTYVLTVPLMCPDTPHLARMPVFAYWYDRFQEGGPFRADVVVPIDSVMDAKITLGMEHASQLYEWLPYNSGTLDQVPEEPAARREFARRRFEARAAAVREHCAPPTAGSRFAEAFQISEYGRQPSAGELRELFPVGEAGVVNRAG
jgi:LmbE family N-acetylglucosaminyl deacetylase